MRALINLVFIVHTHARSSVVQSDLYYWRLKRHHLGAWFRDVLHSRRGFRERGNGQFTPLETRVVSASHDVGFQTELPLSAAGGIAGCAHDSLTTLMCARLTEVSDVRGISRACGRNNGSHPFVLGNSRCVYCSVFGEL